MGELAEAPSLRVTANAEAPTAEAARKRAEKGAMSLSGADTEEAPGLGGEGKEQV